MKYEYYFIELFSTQMRLMKLFQRKTLVTEDVLSHYYEVDSAWSNRWFIILHIISNPSPAQGPSYTRCSTNMEQRGTFCFQELQVLVEDWRGRWTQIEGKIKWTSQDMLPDFEQPLQPGRDLTVTVSPWYSYKKKKKKLQKILSIPCPFLTIIPSKIRCGKRRTLK